VLSLAVECAEGQKESVHESFPRPKTTQIRNGDWLNEVTKTRDMDQDFRERITNYRVYICEKHFEAEDIEICKLYLISCLP